ncbi:MAG TPA: M23 family metallopeptidase, partial [Candidatus Eisenbacteria bacterium]
MAPPPFESRLHRSPLAAPLVLNGGFGDFRGGHFHAGFDFGTRRRTGRPVHAPESGWIERIRSSGVGYGRALYLRARDGRILEFGHLDAFAGAVGAFVEHLKDSTGEYEQDIWPARGEFPVRAGDIVAWTGESGAGGPHLHFEIRRADVALNPLRAGLAVADSVPPSLVELTLEPLDDRAQVEGRYGPHTVSLARTDTVRAIGRLRAIVKANDQTARGGSRIAPWSVAVEWSGRRTECRFDSVSWATDMPEAEYVYDTGRVTGRRGFVLWSAAGFRPRVLVSDAPAGEEAGTIEIRPGDPPRTLVVSARDLAGKVVTRRVVLRAAAPPPGSGPGWWIGETPWSDATVEFASLPGGFLRVGFPGRAAKRDLEIQVGAASRHSTRAGGAWSATLSVPPNTRAESARLPLAMRADRSTEAPMARGGVVWARHASAADSFELADEKREVSVRFAASSLFEDATVLTYPLPAGEQRGLTPVGRAWQVEPSALPLRRSARIAMVAPDSAPQERVGLYRLDSNRWQWVGARLDSVTRAVSGESRRLGRFALFRDETGPKVALLQPAAPKSNRGPYSRWSVEASVTDAGSGVDAGRSYLEIDGRKAPTEWDPEAGRLRW